MLAQTQAASYSAWGRPPPARRGVGLTAAILVHLLPLLLLLDFVTSPSATTAEIQRGTTTMMSVQPARLIPPPPKPASEPLKPLMATISPSRLAAPPPQLSEQVPISIEMPDLSAVAAASSPAMVSASDLEFVPFPKAYLMRLSRMVLAELVRPRDSARGRSASTAIVRVQFVRDGTLLDATVVQSAGLESLDRAARNAVLRLGRLPPVPRDVMPSQQNFVILQPVEFGWV